MSPSEVLSREMSHDPSSVDPTIPSFHFAQLCKHPARVERDIAGVDPVPDEWPGYASRFPVAREAKPQLPVRQDVKSRIEPSDVGERLRSDDDV